ncbi:response regulator [Paenibacillus sp. BSR1-1]|uniref:response regulator n=1 Tax=Paenibacillus sp. BSR1-1 TaxID=3020845 RepID=UPI0025B23478|nr:response regulator [Paenibacillus sp. BSR1-1]MDN3019095.1 response regulator [Paenibacillus sp. BSR1-1]
MYRVLIIDDEPFISKGLSEKIDWASLGCMICGIASNGYEGKEQIDLLKPDIVVSDIVMPGQTGLELADYVHQNYKDMIIILLSGYDEFTFAKEALKYGVFDYLLKPTVIDEVMNVIKKAVKALEQKRNQEKKYEYLESALQESIPIIEQSLLHDVSVKGIVNSQNVSQRIDQFNITLGKGAVITIEVYGDLQSKQVIEALRTSIEELCKSKNLTVRFVNHNQQLLVFPAFPFRNNNKEIKTHLKDLSNSIFNYSIEGNRIKALIGIGGVYTSIHSIHTSYLQSLKALTKSFFIGSGKIHFYDEINDGMTNYDFSTKSARFIEMFEEWTQEEILHELETIFKEIKYTYDKRLVLNHCLELLIKLGLVVAKWDRTFKMVVGYEQLEQCQTFDELKDFMKQTCVSIKNHLYEMMNQNNIGVVELAKRMVEKEYANPDLSTQFIADQLNVSVSYLSRSFKKETGENLSNFITEKRMLIAQKLLMTTDLKTNEVAKRVGFLDARYFGQVFKKIMRTTPSDYKKLP